MMTTLMTPADALATLDLETPVGTLRLAAEGDALVALELPGRERSGPASAGARRHPVLRRAAEQLAEWFAGERRDFDLPLRPAGTPFQEEVWRALLAIPYGATESYAALAARVGRPGAARAVGAANGRNPIAIVVPCHRVIGASGALTGYGGGLPLKRWLLAHEQSVLARIGADATAGGARQPRLRGI
jgi:methylated-DNA-[protein]-cysteine S-methyltransferase